MIINASRKHATKKPGPTTGCRIRVYPVNSPLEGGYTVLYHLNNKRVIYFWLDFDPSGNDGGGGGLDWETLNLGAVFTLTQE